MVIIQFPFIKVSTSARVSFKYHSSINQASFKYHPRIIKLPFKYDSNIIQVSLKYQSSIIQVSFTYHKLEYEEAKSTAQHFPSRPTIEFWEAGTFSQHLSPGSQINCQTL